MTNNMEPFTRQQSPQNLKKQPGPATGLQRTSQFFDYGRGGSPQEVESRTLFH